MQAEEEEEEAAFTGIPNAGEAAPASAALTLEMKRSMSCLAIH
jgi:hypothetical protein